jgi:hypothetical protein
MKKVNTILGQDLYVGSDESKNFKPWYNIVPNGGPAPAKGYYSAEFIASQKKIAVCHFFPEKRV